VDRGARWVLRLTIMACEPDPVQMFWARGGRVSRWICLNSLDIDS
jgi:hypothetical protein